MTAAVAGIFFACYIGTASPANDGMGYELNAIAAAVVGGCSLAGGVGTIAGVVLGTILSLVVWRFVPRLPGLSSLRDPGEKLGGRAASA